MSPILLDTHAAMWAAEGALPIETADILTDAASRNELLISPISAWEIGMLVGKKRLELHMPVGDYVRGLFAQRGVVTATLTPGIAAAATSLPGKFHADPADRILIATAAALGARMVTRDRKIQAYARATGHIRCLPC
jgi:PIN domain nuclease of toxin-antitoxin system